MKLPEKIKGRNRIRDGAIVLFFKRDDLSPQELAERFKLTERRIYKILETNHVFIQRNKEWEKEKRIARLSRWLKANPVSKRDPLEIQEQLRKEIEGDKPLIDQSVHNNSVTYVWEDSKDKIQPPRLPVGELERSGEI
jgi:hypothetical protein